MTTIEQTCTLLKNFNQSKNTDQLKTYLDTLVNELNKTKSLTNAKVIQQIIASLSNVNLLDHQLFVILCNYYFDLLCRWRTGQTLDSDSSLVFTQIAILFCDQCRSATDNNLESLKTIWINERLINEICICLKEISVDGKHLQDEHVEAIDHFLHGINHLEKGRVEIQNMKLISKLREHIIDCVCSKQFIRMFNEIGELEILNASQTLLLDTCTDMITWYDAQYYKPTHITIRTTLLDTFNSFLKNHLSSFQNLSRISIKILGQLSITLIGGNASDEEIFPAETRQGYCTMIDYLSILLKSIVELKTMNELSIMLTRVLGQCLYSLTMTNDLRTYMKTKQIISLLLELTNIEDETIQFHVYRILATLLTEEDIKTLANPQKIAYVFLNFFRNLIDDATRMPRFYNLLRSLKILIQHDQIKEEVTKQEILPLLLRCAIEPKFDPIKACLPALEILLSLTFNDKATEQLRTNSQFISHLKILVKSSSEERLQRAAEAILWKLEKEDTISTSAINLHEKTYHIMLSYSHSDKDLCYHIHDRLVQDQFRVWIDRDEMHGQTMVAMADAIENSEFVFICMSEAYKQSAFCQSEAHYGFQRQCLLVPLIMKENYRPDGWLGILVSGKIYIDFPKLGFDLAYEKLKTEINRHRTNKNQMPAHTKNASIEHSLPTVDQAIVSNLLMHPSLERSVFKNYPKSIDDWTQDHVRSFLLNENFNNLLPVVGNMNGHLLHETYRKCQTHWDFMFQTFQNEIKANGQKKSLDLHTFIRFIDELGKYVPREYDRNSQKSSTICTLL